MSGKVLVFAPAPVLTVTVEQAAGAPDLHVHPGGQGVWQARMAATLGSDVTLCVSVGGETGELLDTLLAGQESTVRSVRRSAGSGWYVHDRRAGTREAVADWPGAPLQRHDLDELYTIALAEGLHSDVTVLSGPADPTVVDPDVYRRLTTDLTGNGIRVVADLSGDHLKAVLRGGVAFVKVSHEELLRDGRSIDDTEDAFVAAGRTLLDDGAEAALVSRAGDPALAFFDGTVQRVHVPRLQIKDHRGAGDSMSAGVAAVLARGGDLGEAIRTGAAAGALNVTRHGLGTGRADAIEALLSRVRLESLG
ncbi:1-phosphofructokinase family hexose kinase [Dactylosporangium siamense]|uniref:1-phosphofructokinase n=1 Tax=Dactylosporangium siamense TaxID=685454 RepID=A0A919UFU1_9ACTN|nr:PfkB family carbohydrate kinase [Dactylosporangium siamense]GIG49960.1 1-phosphofructokinase [Dactylosporangium siamense]